MAAAKVVILNSAFVGVAVGLVLIFAILASAATAVTEWIARFIGLRAEYLLRGLRTLLVENNTFKLRPFAHQETSQEAGRASQTLTKILEHPVIAASGPKGGPGDAGNAHLTRSERRALPSYISARAFSQAVIEAVLPDATGATTLDELKSSLQANHALPVDDSSRLDERTYALMMSLVRQTDGDINRLRGRLEELYDDHMARVSGWYKRHVRWITLGVGAVLVLVLNLNAVRVASALYLDAPLRAAVVAQAQKPSQCDPAKPNDCLNSVRSAVEPLASAGLPIGWTAIPDCKGGSQCSWWARYGITSSSRTSAGHNFLHVLGALLGYVAMILAVLPGARFWYSALDRLNVFRASGTRPTQSPLPSLSQD